MIPDCPPLSGAFGAGLGFQALIPMICFGVQSPVGVIRNSTTSGI